MYFVIVSEYALITYSQISKINGCILPWSSKEGRCLPIISLPLAFICRNLLSQMLIASKCLSIICQSIWADKYVLRWMCDNLNMSNKCGCYEMSNAQWFVDEIPSFFIFSQLKKKKVWLSQKLMSWILLCCTWIIKKQTLTDRSAPNKPFYLLYLPNLCASI